MVAMISVKLPLNPYNVVIAPNSLAQLGEQLGPLALGHKVLLVSNPEIFGHYGAMAVNSLEQAGFVVATDLIPPGETYKTLESITQIYDAALANRLERPSTLVALGGGVIGDMTGFAAATWLRGVNFVQVPTSLLAMVDAAIGGKTGVNHPHGKNLIGAFYQPRHVLIDPLVLETLPVREFRAGMAEVIKYGIIWDGDLFEKLETAVVIADYDRLDPMLLQTILMRSCQAKADVVSQDEKEGGLRAILNYGHTIGHAIESLTHYNTFVHGEAVGIGMVAAGAIARRLGMWSEEEEKRQLALIQTAGLPTTIPTDLKAETIVETLQTDKKVKAGKVRFVLPHRIGSVQVTAQVSSATIRAVIAELQSPVSITAT